MALKTTVKVGEVTNLSDARYCAGMGVEMLGFCFESEQEKYVDPSTFLALSEWLSGVQYASEFTSYSAQKVEESLALYEPAQSIQVTNPALIPLLQKLETPIILLLDAGEFDSLGSLADVLQQYREDVLYFLLENNQGVAHLTVDDTLQLAEQYPILLGFGVTAENVLSIVDNSAIQGISLKGSEEIKPGYKDFDDLADILEKLEVDEAY
ncbi:MAG: N-(5'-phosphoribosyl)anthranilate isomerase [Cyclobacteriaceae bacterium]